VTLIELVVTLTVLGLLLAVAMPGMSDWMRSTRIRNAAESVQNGLSKARMEAMRRNQAITFWMVSDRSNSCALSSSSGSWVVSVNDPSSLCATPEPTTALIVEAYGARDGAADVVVAASATDGTAATSVSFNGFGQVVSTGTPIAAINLSNTNADARKLRVTISPGGAIRMCDPLVALGDTRRCPP
jgi:type IV fimbrial biogenesis protein FimT